MQGKDLVRANKDDLKAYLTNLHSRDLARNSVKMHFLALHSFYDFLIESDIIEINPVNQMRKRYIRSYKKAIEPTRRQIISIEDASRLVNSILDTRDRCIVLLLFKTGIRLHELVDLDIDDINLNEQTLIVKPTPKRSNRVIFFDNEVMDAFHYWLKLRKKRTKEKALFVASPSGHRLGDIAIYNLVRKYAARVGLHDPKSDRSEDKFTPHCCRHWLTTHLIRSGMPRDYVKELRGDARREAIDIYSHIDKKALKESYLAHIPRLVI